MTKAYKTSTTVLPGHRIEVTAPDVEVGRRVEVIVLVQSLPEADPASPPPARKGLAFLNDLPRITRSETEWVARDRQFQAERDAWDR